MDDRASRSVQEIISTYQNFDIQCLITVANVSNHTKKFALCFELM